MSAAISFAAKPPADVPNRIDALPRGLAVARPPQLFSGVGAAQFAEWATRFGGG